MFVAQNESGKRIYALKSTDRNVEYYCPMCGGRVRLRAGDINAPHFSHISTKDCDDFTHDMSEWHRDWQMLFPEENREVVVDSKGEKHRADVLCYGTVIEFQHTPIAEAEFWRRNNFYTAAGYKVVWIFDLIEQYDWSAYGRLYCIGGCYKQGTEQEVWESFRWKHPWRFLRKFVPQEQSEIAVYFQFGPFVGDGKDPTYGYMERVTWVDPYITPSWGWFYTSYEVANYADLVEKLRQRCKEEGNRVSAAGAL